MARLALCTPQVHAPGTGLPSRRASCAAGSRSSAASVGHDPFAPEAQHALVAQPAISHSSASVVFGASSAIGRSVEHITRRMPARGGNRQHHARRPATYPQQRPTRQTEWRAQTRPVLAITQPMGPRESPKPLRSIRITRESFAQRRDLRIPHLQIERPAMHQHTAGRSPRRETAVTPSRPGSDPRALSLGSGECARHLDIRIAKIISPSGYERSGRVKRINAPAPRPNWALSASPGTRRVPRRSAGSPASACQTFAHQLVLEMRLRMAGAIQRRDHASLLIKHRNSERDDAVGEFILDRRVAGAAALLDKCAQLLRVGDGAASVSATNFCVAKVLL